MEQTILTPQQQQFLELFASNQPVSKLFYFTGGTVLTEYYLHHRLSEDLDFFSESEFNTHSLTVFIKVLQKKLGFETYDYQQSFNRNLFFLHFPDGYILKTEFTFFPFKRIDTSVKKGALQIDSLIDISVNKLFTIYQNPRSRDFIDLYCTINQQPEWSLAKLRAKAKIKFDWHIDPLQLGAQFVKVKDLLDLDYPRMIKIVDKDAVGRFFLEESKKLDKEILQT